MTRVCAEEVSRSIADCASRASVVIDNHSIGRLPVRGDDRRLAAMALHDQLVEVVGLGGIQGPKREIVE